MLRLGTIAGLSVWLMSSATDALAGDWPHPETSTVPTCITLVGKAAGVTDPAGTFSVTARDAISHPIQSCTIEVDFSGCADSHIASQADQAANTSVDPARKSIRLLTNASGVASFTIAGSGVPGYSGTPSGLRCARIYGDGILLGTVTVRVLDLDGSGGVGLQDLAIIVSDYYSGATYGRTDYDCSGSLSLVDISVWATQFYSGHSAESPTTFAW